MTEGQAFIRQVLEHGNTDSGLGQSENNCRVMIDEC